MRAVVFASQAKKDYEYWAKHNEIIFIKITKIITNIDLQPYEGIGKPEPLKHELAGFWSRRISKKDRLVYCISADNEIYIASCKGHY